jgi:hypothetical protein
MAGAGGRTGESLLLAIRRSMYFALFAAQVFTFNFAFHLLYFLLFGFWGKSLR